MTTQSHGGATAASVAAVVASVIALTVASGGAATFALGAFYVSTAASAAQFGAGAVAGDRRHMVSGGIGVTVGGMNSLNWMAAGSMDVSRRVAAGVGLYSEAMNLGTSQVVSQSVGDGC